jgi:hypothetical protein
MAELQNFKNHAKVVPAFHFFVLPMLMVNLVSQLVGMRFASDAELPELARRVLEERIAERKAIKALVRDWQADELRA